MFSILKNKLYRFNRWLDKNESFKFILLISITGIGMINIQFGNLLLGVLMMLLLCAFSLYRMFVIDDDGRTFESRLFDRSIYDVPSVGETVIVKKDFYYVYIGLEIHGKFKKFKKFINSQKSNWWRVSKGTEMVILEVEETNGDWKIRFIDSTCSSSLHYLELYYLETKDYWDTKSNIRNKVLSKIGI